MILRRDDVVVGVDTHKDEHAAVLLDGLGGNPPSSSCRLPPKGSRTYSPSPPATLGRMAG
jgi:hypothetical protein